MGGQAEQDVSDTEVERQLLGPYEIEPCRELVQGLRTNILQILHGLLQLVRASFGSQWPRKVLIMENTRIRKCVTKHNMLLLVVLQADDHQALLATRTGSTWATIYDGEKRKSIEKAATNFLKKCLAPQPQVRQASDPWIHL